MELNSSNLVKTQCEKCDSSGYMKTEPVLCRHCSGNICIYCENNGGYYKGIYETCDKCFGDGEYINNLK